MPQTNFTAGAQTNPYLARYEQAIARRQSGRGQEKRAEDTPSPVAPSDTAEISPAAREKAATAQTATTTTAEVTVEVETGVATETDPTTESPSAPAPSGVDQSRLDTREGRAETASEYDAILAGLREEYSEEEALKRFDEIMRGDGFQTKDTPWTSGSFFRPLQVRKLDPAEYPELYSNLIRFKDRLKFAPHTFHNDSNLTAHSGVFGLEIAGKVETVASTTVTYRVPPPDYSPLTNAWIGKNTDTLPGVEDFDLDAFTQAANKYPHNNFAPEAVNRDLGALVSDMLQEAGVELKPGQNVTFYANEDADGNLLGLDPIFNFGVEAEHDRFVGLFKERLAEDPALFQAFADQHAAVPRTDPRALADSDMAALLDTTATYQQRSFMYSADQPGAVVMGDRLLLANAFGIAYSKKISDSYNPTSESIGVGAYGANPRDQNETFKATVKFANANTEAGEKTESTMSPLEALAYLETLAAASPGDEYAKKMLENARRQLGYHQNGI